MSTTTPPAFELPNVGAGPDPLSLEAVGAAADFAIVLMLRHYHCPMCRARVRKIVEWTESIERDDTVVIVVLPNGEGKAGRLAAKYDLPFALLADPDGEICDGFEQRHRFGRLGRLHDLIGRMPKAVVLDLRGEPAIVEDHDGKTPADRPALADLLGTVDEVDRGFVFDCKLVSC